MDYLKKQIMYGTQKAKAMQEIEDAWDQRISDFPLWMQWRKEVIKTKEADRANILRLISRMPKSEEQAWLYNFVMAMERSTLSYRELCDEVDAYVRYHNWPGMEELADLIHAAKVSSMCANMREQIKDIEMHQFRNNRALEAIKEELKHD